MEQIKYFFEDYGKYIYASLGAIAIGFLVWIAVTTGDGTEDVGIVEAFDGAKEKSEDLSNYFSEFGSYQLAPSTTKVAYEIDLYLKEPFISEVGLREKIDTYIELQKWKTKNPKTKTYLLGLKINIYDREILYREGLEPRATVTYMLAEEDKKKRKKEDKYLEDTDMRWEHTITQEKEPDYTKYQTRVNFTAYKEITGNIPLSDEEFAFLMKILKYGALRDGSLKSGARMYLQWDLGSRASLEGITQVLKEFETFANRHRRIGGGVGYYEDTIELQKTLAVSNPRFLVYALTTEVIDDKILAKRRLISLDARLYLDVYLKDAQKKYAEGNLDTSTQEALDGGELTDDELETIEAEQEQWSDSLDDVTADEFDNRYDFTEGGKDALPVDGENKPADTRLQGDDGGEVEAPLEGDDETDPDDGASDDAYFN